MRFKYNYNNIIKDNHVDEGKNKNIDKCNV